MGKLQRKQLSITFHDPNEPEVIASFIVGLIARNLAKKALEDPSSFLERVSTLEKGDHK